MEFNLTWRLERANDGFPEQTALGGRVMPGSIMPGSIMLFSFSFLAHTISGTGA